MVTKEQAIAGGTFMQIAGFPASGSKLHNGMVMQTFDTNKTVQLDKPKRWRSNGKCKVWKRDERRFQLPVKHGLYEHGYIDNTNCHLFEIEFKPDLPHITKETV